MKLFDALKIYKKSPNNSLSIFLFHGVINKLINKNTVTNYNNKHINLKNFKFFIKNISKLGNPISMDEVYKNIKEKKNFSKKSFAITFDDGFENNISVAAPVLFGLKIPFTFYITTEFVDKNSMSWIDKIDYAVDKTKKKNIEIPELNKKYNIRSQKGKIYLLEKIRKYLKNNNKIDPYKFANNFCNKLKIKKFPTKNLIYKKMNWSQLRKISRNKLCTIGGHSHTHRILNYLNHGNLVYEIQKSIKLIKKNLGFKVGHYSYPEGFKKSFSSKVINLLKKNNIKCCPTALEGINKGKLNPFLLKRISIN